jgi:hypothetical protein
LPATDCIEKARPLAACSDQLTRGVGLIVGFTVSALADALALPRQRV